MSMSNLEWKWKLEDVCRKQDRYCPWSAKSIGRFRGDIKNEMDLRKMRDKYRSMY